MDYTTNQVSPTTPLPPLHPTVFLITTPRPRLPRHLLRRPTLPHHLEWLHRRPRRHIRLHTHLFLHPRPRQRRPPLRQQTRPRLPQPLALRRRLRSLHRRHQRQFLRLSDRWLPGKSRLGRSDGLGNTVFPGHLRDFGFWGGVWSISWLDFDNRDGYCYCYATKTGAPVSQISDGQPQAPTGAPVTQISDGQPQAPTGAPVSQISDGQPQAPTGTPVSQISDGQPQVTTSA